MALPSKKNLELLYLNKNYSAAQIGKKLGFSTGKVNYWLSKHEIKKRSISHAIYARHNPKGDPFLIKIPTTIEEAILYGMGIGLYWGEGNKMNKTSVRLGNVDPKLIRKFILFLRKIYGIDPKKLKFGLQVFSDVSAPEALRFWQKQLKASPEQFQKVVITPTRGEGTYRRKSVHGVLTVYYNNVKLRDLICRTIENL